MTAETAPPEPKHSDLDALQTRQAALYAALARYQMAASASGEALVAPGTFGLAAYCRVHPASDHDKIEAVLVHSDGGEISGGSLLINPGSPDDMQDCAAQALALLLNPMAPIGAPAAPAAAKAQTPAPVVVTPEPAPATTPGPEPLDLDAIGEDPQPTDADPVPTPEEVQTVLGKLAALYAVDKTAVKPITDAYKAAHPIGKTPFAESINTRERLQFLEQLIAQQAKP